MGLKRVSWVWRYQGQCRALRPLGHQGYRLRNYKKDPPLCSGYTCALATQNLAGCVRCFQRGFQKVFSSPSLSLPFPLPLFFTSLFSGLPFLVRVAGFARDNCLDNGELLLWHFLLYFLETATRLCSTLFDLPVCSQWFAASLKPSPSPEPQPKPITQPERKSQPQSQPKPKPKPKPYFQLPPAPAVPCGMQLLPLPLLPLQPLLPQAPPLGSHFRLAARQRPIAVSPSPSASPQAPAVSFSATASSAPPSSVARLPVPLA